MPNFVRSSRHELLLEAAHAAFDRLWMDLGGAITASRDPRPGQRRKSNRVVKAERRICRRQRTAAYAWLARQLGMIVEDCHLRYMTESQLERVIAICRTTDARTVRLWNEH